MSIHPLASQDGRPLELDICFACQGLWFDPQENLKLTPASVVELFRLLHEQRDAMRHPLARRLACPRCQRSLDKGFDVVRSGRYVTYRCPRGHGRFSAFSSFMVEKGFVRQLTKPEIDDIAQRVAVIYCTGCGAPVDLRKDHACPHCRSRFRCSTPPPWRAPWKAMPAPRNARPPPRPLDLADALISLERDRLKAEREAKAERGSLFETPSPHRRRPLGGRAGDGLEDDQVRPRGPDYRTRKNRISTRSGKRAPVPTNKLSVSQASAGDETSKVGAQRK
jgi:hypothetical protein